MNAEPFRSTATLFAPRASSAWLLAMLIVLLAGGCQRTLFSQPPSATTACDPALLGTWVSIGEGGSQDGEIEATVSADCRVAVIERRADGPRIWPPVRLASGRIGGRDVLWLDATTTNLAYKIDAEAIDREGSVYVFAYQPKGAELRLQPPNHRALAHQVVDGKLEGAAVVEGHNIVVRLDGDADALAKVIAKRASFQRRETLRFRRPASSQ